MASTLIKGHTRVSAVQHNNSTLPSPPLPQSPQSSRSDSPPRVSSGQSVLNLVTCILGAGVLGFPYCFKSCGLVLATLIMAVSLLATRFSYQLLLYCCQLSPKRSYEELAEQAVGRVGRVLVQLCTVALNLGAVVAYLNILADVISSVAGTIIPPGAEPSRSAYLAGEQGQVQSSHSWTSGQESFQMVQIPSIKHLG